MGRLRKKCCITTCQDRSRQISFHEIPAKLELRTKWFNNMSLALGPIRTGDYSTICNLHFDSNMFKVTRNGKRRLQDGAVPTVFTNLGITSAKTKSVKAKQGIALVKTKQDQYFHCEQSHIVAYFCKHCSYTTHMAPLFNNHVKSCYQANASATRNIFVLTLYKCKTCSFQTFSQLVLLRHELCCLTRLHKCKQCEYRTKSKSRLKDHFLIHIPEKDLKLFHCDLCEYKGKRLFYLKRHIKMHIKKKKFKCNSCDLTTSSTGYLYRHVMKEHLPDECGEWYNCDKCEYKTRFSWDLKNHRIRHLPEDQVKWLHCRECTYKCKTHMTLSKHREMHREMGDYKCDKCKYETTRKSYLNRHMRYKHLPDEKRNWFMCDFCGFRTKTNHKLKTHIIVKHTLDDNIEWFKCTKCDYRGKTRVRLKNHFKTHSVKKDLQCEQCDYETNRKHYMEAHVRKKHLTQNQTINT